MKIIHSLLLCCKSHIHCLKQKEEGVTLLRVIGMSFLSWPVCLLARPCDMDMIAGEGRVCGEEGERVLHRGFGSTFVVDPRARHGIACHCCSRDSSVFSSSLALEMDLNNSHLLLSLMESRLQVNYRSIFFFFSLQEEEIQKLPRKEGFMAMPHSLPH